MTATATWSKIRLLLWKNSLLQRRQYIRTALEILKPVLIVGVWFIVRGLISNLPTEIELEERNYPPLSIDTLDPLK